MQKFKLFQKSSDIIKSSFLYYKEWKYSNNILYKKYSSFKFSYILICVNNLMFNEKCRIVSRFKDYLIYDDDTEFLRIHYKKEILRKTLIKVYDFYDKYNKVFPNYMILPENVYMYKNLRKKQKMIDIHNNILAEKKKNGKNKKKNLNNNENKKTNIYIFDEKVKENINRQNNSMLTLSLTNTVISNYINYNDNKKFENILDNNSFVESNINNSSISISLYSKRSLFNDNNNIKRNNNFNLYNDTLRSELSLENIVAVLNNKKFKKMRNRNNSKCKNLYKFLSIDIISNANDNKYSEKSRNNNILMNNLKTHNCAIKTPKKNKLFKKENKHFNHIQLKSLNNNRQFFIHKKTTSDARGMCSLIKNSTEILSQKKFKCMSKFPKENINNNIIEKITTSLLHNYKNNQRNKNKKKAEEKYLENNSKKMETLAKSIDIYDNLKLKITNIKEINVIKEISKEKNKIKVNNYSTFKRMSNSKYMKNNGLFRYNKILLEKRKKVEEEEKNNDNSKKRTISKNLEEKLKFTLNHKIKEKKKENTKPTIDADSTESTKISMNLKKTKFNFNINYDKINNTNNQIYIFNTKNKVNKEILQTQPRDENVSNNYNTSNNFNMNYYNNINNTEITVINNYTYGNNLLKNIQKQKKNIIDNKKNFHKKHKTFSLQMANNNDLLFAFNNKRTNFGENKHRFDNKLKKIKEEILNSKNNFKDIKDKYRKLSESNNIKNVSNLPAPCQKKKFEKGKTNSVLNNNSIERKENNYKKINNISKCDNYELIYRLNNKAFKRNNFASLSHQRNYSIFSNTFKSPFAKKIIKEYYTKENIEKSKEKIITNKRDNKKLINMKKN